MCVCTPSIRTPWCGRANCKPPKPEGTRESEISRRNYLDQNTEEELSLRASIAVIEAMPAHPKLTECVVLLGKALSSLSDYVDLQQTS